MWESALNERRRRWRAYSLPTFPGWGVLLLFSLLRRLRPSINCWPFKNIRSIRHTLQNNWKLATPQKYSNSVSWPLEKALEYLEITPNKIWTPKTVRAYVYYGSIRVLSPKPRAYVLFPCLLHRFCLLSNGWNHKVMNQILTQLMNDILSITWLVKCVLIVQGPFCLLHILWHIFV